MLSILLNRCSPIQGSNLRIPKNPWSAYSRPVRMPAFRIRSDFTLETLIHGLTPTACCRRSSRLPPVVGDLWPMFHLE